MKTYLDKIIDYKRDELSALKRRVPLSDLKKKAGDREAPRPFLKALEMPGVRIIAEVKKASPSAGVICDDFKPVDTAFKYQEGGASALSVLTDGKFFQGSLEYLQGIKKKVALPCLRKDFTLHEYHVFEARAHDADAILLIAACLDPVQLKDYQAIAVELGMGVLVEVHDQEELEGVLKVGPKLVGVNNRNLKTFEVDLKTSLDLIQKIPDSVVAISESGLKTKADLDRLGQAGFDGFLMGEALMREKDVVGKLKALVG